MLGQGSIEIAESHVSRRTTVSFTFPFSRGVVRDEVADSVVALVGGAMTMRVCLDINQAPCGKPQVVFQPQLCPRRSSEGAATVPASLCPTTTSARQQQQQLPQFILRFSDGVLIHFEILWTAIPRRLIAWALD
ncbi:hypothetical protein HPB50_015087 [Hyalomma asiaticum]|uniref:Uncharacterized protein n=1 Tax=Hyalomma asiaticum TaxID=266040 RepID=A0ACB7TAA6_HYAAI|nr:hypothetical protein HPB50_015087 [Hyalomma asiaticum]